MSPQLLNPDLKNEFLEVWKQNGAGQGKDTDRKWAEGQVTLIKDPFNCCILKKLSREEKLSAAAAAAADPTNGGSNSILVIFQFSRQFPHGPCTLNYF